MGSMRRFITMGLVLVAMSPAAVYGQACLGQPSFTLAPVQLNGTFTTGGDITTLGGGVAFGGSGAFASVNAALVDFDNVDESAFTIGGGVGLQFSGSTPSTSSNVRALQFCPLASFEYQNGPEFDVLGETLDLSAWSLAGGINLGVPIVSGGLQLIPTGGAALAYTKFTADAGAFGSESESETYGIISLGLGFVMNEIFSVKPFVAIPVGLEDADSRFGIIVTLGLRR